MRGGVFVSLETPRPFVTTLGAGQGLDRVWPFGGGWVEGDLRWEVLLGNVGMGGMGKVRGDQKGGFFGRDPVPHCCKTKQELIHLQPSVAMMTNLSFSVPVDKGR